MKLLQISHHLPSICTTVWQPIQGKNDITLGFFAVLPISYVYNTRTIEREIFPGALFEYFSKSEKIRPIFNADSTGVCWLNFWFHIVNLGKIPFHLIGRTLYFCKEFKFSFFESPLQKSNGGSKYENFISVLNHIVWPIKWKEILHRITIWNQKMSQYNSQESALPPPFLWAKNRFFFKNPSREDFLLDCSCIVHIWA